MKESGFAAPLRTGEANHIRYHQPKKSTVRESGVEGLSPLGPQTSFANPWSGTDSTP